MSREMDGRFKCSYPLKVRYAETDAQGHVFFGNYYTYFDEALLEYMRTIGYSYPALLDDGMDLLYVESLCRHFAPAHFDDTLNVFVRIASIGNSSLTFEFSIYRDGSEQLVATGHIKAVNVDKVSRRPERVPEELRRRVQEYES
jgi:acyl-CoA thioester hydrolase